MALPENGGRHARLRGLCVWRGLGWALGRREKRSRSRNLRRRTARVALTGVCWLLPALGLGASAGALGAAWINPFQATTLGWLASLASDLVAQALALTLVGAALAAGCRRWAALLVSMGPTLVLVTLVLGVDRAPRAGGDAAGPVVRVVAANAMARNHEPEGIIEALLTTDADLVMLNEPSMALQRALADTPSVRAAFPHDTRIERAGPGFRYVLSRHPLLEGEDAFGALWPELREALGYHGQRLVRVEMPEGPFVFAGVQFRSPRRPDRWAGGNAQAQDLARGLTMVRDAVRLPVVLAGDLNSTPTGRRSRDLAEAAGLRRTKPVLALGGTYPAGWPLSASIDGVMVSESVRVRRWWTFGLPGSDHEGVAAELELPGVASPSAP